MGVFNIKTAIFIMAMAMLQCVSASGTAEDLEGTWSSKSNTVFTGPGFYDPVDELLIEPDLPGISYSFTSDGHYEEALYRVTSNPQNHSCATATLIYQHGTYEILGNGTLSLTPIAVDGRQLVSDPCNHGDSSQYTRYVQPTYFLSFDVSVSAYHGRTMLQLYQFDGSKMQPLYLSYRPPTMLPTYALNPTDRASETKTSLRRRVRRSFESKLKTNAKRDVSNDRYDFYWWISVSCLAVVSGAVFMR